MDGIVFTQLDGTDPSNGGWMDYAEDGGTRTSFWTAPAGHALGMIEFAVTSLSSAAPGGGCNPGFEVIGLRSSGAEIVFEQLDVDTAVPGWTNDGEGGLLSIWTALVAPGGAFAVTVTAVPDADPRVEVTWIPFGPVAQSVPVARADANVIDLASWRTRQRPN